MSEYYHNLITKKSFEILQSLKKDFDFILIGGWAIWLYTKNLKSKDVDLVCDYDVLEKMRTKFDLFKNQRLKKYEVKIGEIDVDIYLPYFSDLGLPIEEIKKYTLNLGGFTVFQPEILLILKQKTFQQRQGSAKGEKDKIDIISLLSKIDLDFNFYKKILKEHNQKNIQKELINLCSKITEVKELNLNKHKYSQLKKKILRELE